MLLPMLSVVLLQLSLARGVSVFIACKTRGARTVEKDD